MSNKNDPEVRRRRAWSVFWAGKRHEGALEASAPEKADPKAAIEALEAEFGPLPADFDALVYAGLHPDLAGMRNDTFGAVDHYLRYGRGEGRRYKPGVSHLEIDFGQLPADFDAELYIDLHADLETFRGDPDAAATHYLEEGRVEGRFYKRLTAGTLKRLPVDLDQKKPKAPEKVPDRRLWANRLNVADFRALNPDHGKEIRTRTDAIRMFQERGIERVAPLALDQHFDPDFYRARHPELASLDPVAAYRHWLSAGLHDDLPGSEAELVHNLLSETAFPEGFDWETYAGRVSPRPQSRWAALEHLIETGVGEPDQVPIRGLEAARFLESLAGQEWSRARRQSALRLLERALELDPGHGGRAWKLAMWKQALNDPSGAEALFEQAFRNGYRSVFAVVQLVRFRTGRGDFAGAYELLRQSRAEFSGYGPWVESFDETLQHDFAAGAEAALARYHEADREAGDRLLTESLSRVTGAIQELDDLPAPLRPAVDGHVVLFANHGLAQCRHYRVEQRCRQLDQLSVPFRVFDSEAPAKAREALVGARALIVYREPAYPETIRLVLHARAMGIPTFYEIDDLIFDAAHYPDSFESYGQQISFEDYVGLLYGVPLFRFAATLCDRGIASTTALARHLGPLTRERLCDVVPNGLDERNDRFLRSEVPARGTDDDVFIFYGSGAKAHNRNFNETVGPALVELMRARPRVRLIVIGHLDLDPAFEPFRDRVLRYPFSTDLAAYWALLSEVDINLAVLLPGEMNDGKSEIKWLEAGVSAVPSVVSATATYREVVRDGVDGVLADSPGAWREALFRLVDDPALRRRIGLAARARAEADYGLPATAARLGAVLRAVAVPNAASPPAGKTRVLVVHVLFPPQTFGGATRVVRDNVDDLLARYGGSYEIAAFTTDFDAPEDTSRVGSYGSTPVFRCGRNTTREFDYRDERIADRFDEVLKAWAPDLVHFHCIQFLCGSIVERCRRAAIPYVVTVHDGWWISPYQFLVDDDFFLRLPAPRAIEEHQEAETLVAVERKRYLADRLGEAAVITAVSESFAEIYRGCGFTQTRAVPNGLSAQFLAHRGRTGRRRPRAEGRQRVRIGHIGGRSHHKGIHLLQVALQRSAFRHLDAVIIDHAEEAMFRSEATWGTTPVTFRGTVPQDRVIDLYESLDVLIAPSTWPESFGLVSREALALGLWVVVSDLGALGEDVIEGENGFVIDSGNAEDLARVLGLIDADPGKYVEPPRVPFQPRPASAQTDDFVAIYREVLRSRQPVQE